MQLLFFTRLILYLIAFSFPALHPSIAVPYDRGSWVLWFLLVPGEMLIAFYLSPPKHRMSSWLVWAFGLLIPSAVFFAVFGSHVLLFTLVGCASFILTALIFKTGAWGYRIAVVEPFFLAFLYYRLLEFSRSSEAAARESMLLNQLILFIILLSFLIHGMVLYFAAFHGVKKLRRLKELVLFPLIAAPAVLIAVFLLPPDFVSHSVVMNILGREPQPKPFPLDEYGEGPERGNLLNRRSRLFSSGDRNGDGRDAQEGQKEGEGRLEGIPSDQWQNGKGSSGSGNKQYAVMIVASTLDPVYAAEGYYGEFDPERGFVLERNQKLNDLGFLRLLETWENRAPLYDLKRITQDIFYLSSLPGRVLAYRPQRIEPTVFDRRYHPFDYAYRSLSLVSFSGVKDWTAVRDLTAFERDELAPYLEIEMPESVSDSFKNYLESEIGDTQGYFKKILAIFESFSEFQYELGFTDDVSVRRMQEFIEQTRRGDCTEFSNTAAILGRMAGIPSRVLTGYLVSGHLQSFAHRRALLILRDVIQPLKEFPLQDLYLVTTAHRHSWVQFYLPNYGWVDFDPTSFAIPPLGGGPNSMDVVIPIIEIEEGPATFTFPWLLFVRLFLFLVVIATIALYLFRWARILHLRLLSRGKSQRSLRALYTLLLIKLNTCGYEKKPHSQTALEYSKRYPELRSFAAVYTMIRFRGFYSPGEREKLWGDLFSQYQGLVRQCRKPGIIGTLGRMLSLRGLYYL